MLDEFDFEEINVTEEKFSEIRDVLKTGQIEKASAILDEMFTADIENIEVENNLRAVMFWQREHRAPIVEELKAQATVEVAIKAISAFDDFERFIELKGGKTLKVYDSLKVFIFASALKPLIAELQNEPHKANARLIGRAFVELGMLEEAKEAFLLGLKKDKFDSYVLGYLAHIYYALGDERRAKAFFREALFYDPTDIAFERITSELFGDIWKTVEYEGYSEPEEIKYWLGVYGEMRGNLNVKKKLRKDEMIALRKTISRFEADYKKEEMKRRATPRLLLAYFWLITQLKIEGGRENEVALVLGKIKQIDEKIYSEYEQLIHK